MDSKIEIKDEDALSDDVASQNDWQVFRDVATNRSRDDVLVISDCDMTIETEMKSETPSLDFCTQKDREYFTKCCVSESKTCSKNCVRGTGIEIEEQSLISDFGSHNAREFLPEDSVMRFNKDNSDHDVDSKIEIKEETWLLETQSSSVCDDIKDEDFHSIKSPGSYTEAVSGDSSGKSPLSSAEELRRNESFSMGKNCNEHGHSRNVKCQENYVTEIHSVKETIHSEQSGKYNGGGNTYSMPSHLKQTDFVNEGKKPHKCKICEKRFTRLSHLELHNLIHEGKRPHKCEICEKRFTTLSDLKRHTLIHDGKKPHECDICEKRFTRLSNLKSHRLIHEGEKPHKCEVCEKRFTRLSDWKTHNLIHEGKKPHQCEVCERRFTRLSDLKSHNLIHAGKKPHKCEVCEKRFIALWDLKRHNLVHEGRKPYKCEICEKRFTALSSLRKHNLIHNRKEPYKCELCENTFAGLSGFKRHILIHKDEIEGGFHKT